MTKDNCPHCGVSLIGAEIPDEHKKYYSGTHFRREIGKYDWDLDMIVAWICPDCQKEWPRSL